MNLKKKGQGVPVQLKKLQLSDRNRSLDKRKNIMLVQRNTNFCCLYIRSQTFECHVKYTQSYNKTFFAQSNSSTNTVKIST